MKAKVLAEILLKHPDYMVQVGCYSHLFGYSMEYVGDKMIEVDESMQTFYLGEFN